MSQYAPGTNAYKAEKARDMTVKQGYLSAYGARTDEEVEEMIRKRRQSGAAMPKGNGLYFAMHKLKQGMSMSEAFPGTPKGY